jgi:hypothetical protein
MKNALPLGLMLLFPCAAGAQAPAGLGAEEFGMTQRQLVQAIEQSEALIAKCMREQGFQYVAVDYNAVRAGTKSDKSMLGLSEEDFINKYGFGVATMYTGQPPQLTTGYSPARVGLGERNIQIFKSLSPADQAAYNRALFGENVESSFAMALETQSLSQTGGCTRHAIEQEFPPVQLKTSYYSPQNALINNDSRMNAALRELAAEMKHPGFDYNHPDNVEPDIRTRLAALTNSGSLLPEDISSEQWAERKELQDLERRVTAKIFKSQEELLATVEERIQQGLFSQKVQ